MTQRTGNQGDAGISTERAPLRGTRSQTKRWGWMLPVFLLAPLELGAKGCDSGVVGDDCADAKSCAGTGGGANTGGKPSTGGSANTGGKASTGGAANTGGSPGTTKTCGGLLGTQCASGQYCDYPVSAQCGAADQTGSCQPIPGVCNDIYKPVCGCDDKTYANACEAAAEGVSVAAEGACAGTGTDCGGLLGTACPKGEYCNYAVDALCGAADQTGVCAKVPEACDAVLAPVCGCDGKTYDNDCSAAVAGTSVASKGECPANGETCGGLRGTACPKGQYCNYAPDAQCGAADQTGVCAGIPICDAAIDPVCGCDGKTYQSPCLAAVAGTSVASKGECQATGKACGARLGNTCATGEYCQFTLDAICGFADATGNCAAIPKACTKELAEVCGCNGVSYSNSCVAASAGVSVQYVGRCKPTPTGQVCGGLTGAQCSDPAQYCAYPVEAQCGAADQTGTCATKPDACITLYDPVCGCDGKTYGNSCDAASAGMSVASDGECP